MSVINSFPRADMMAMAMYIETRKGIRFVAVILTPADFHTVVVAFELPGLGVWRRLLNAFFLQTAVTAVRREKLDQAGQLDLSIENVQSMAEIFMH
jgi:hypothetical protein